LETDENISDAIVLLGRKFNRILMRIERKRKSNVMNSVMSNVEAYVDSLHSSLKETINQCDVVRDVETSLAQPDNQDGVTDVLTDNDSWFSTSKGEESEDQNAT
jgi:deoxyadenosine/deoxycytidine kinase